MAKSVATAGRILKEQGALALFQASMEKFEVWWRHGDPFEVAKYMGRPSPIARLQGCRFSLDSPALTDNVRYLLLSGKHEKPERRLVGRFLDPALPVVELGGCIGVVACITNHRLRDPSRHVVVEANPAMLPLLIENRDRNRCRFTVVHSAVGYGASSIEFDLDENPLISRVKSSGVRSISVPATSLQEILGTCSFERCTLICDIEGAEGELVRHEERTLADRVALMVVEIHERTIGREGLRGLTAGLARAGFVEIARQWDTMVLRNARLTGHR